MDIIVRGFTTKDLPSMTEIWNCVVEDGIAFPQEEKLNIENGLALFAGQSFTGVVEDKDTGEILGLYILHPNSMGRCSHISNASFAVKKESRGLHIGEKLVLHCLEKAKELGFRIIQFNAVVSTNHGAIHLYEKLGFVRLGTIPEGFLMKNGSYEDIVLFYKTL